MQSVVDLQNLKDVSVRKSFFLNGVRLCLRVVKGILRTPVNVGLVRPQVYDCVDDVDPSRVMSVSV